MTGQLRLLGAAVITALTGRHAYLSTGCLHGRHDYCQAKQGRVGPKVPATCKFCKAPCRCRCHRATA